MSNVKKNLSSTPPLEISFLLCFISLMNLHMQGDASMDGKAMIV